MCAVGTQLAPSTQTGPPLPISDHNPFPEPLGVAPQLTVGCDHSSPPALYSPLGGQPCSPDLWTLRRQERDALRRAHSSLLAPNFSTVSHTWSSVISSSSSRLSCPGAISYQGGERGGKTTRGHLLLNEHLGVQSKEPFPPEGFGVWEGSWGLCGGILHSSGVSTPTAGGAMEGSGQHPPPCSISPCRETTGSCCSLPLHFPPPLAMVIL